MEKNANVFGGLALTLLLHILVAGVAVSKTGGMGGCSRGDDEKGFSNFKNAQTIEAALAFKEVAPKNKQPQKKKRKKFKPAVDDGASKEEELVKPPKEKKERIPVEEKEIDINSILEKNRKQDEDLSDYGSDEVPVEGSQDGSEEWGTEKDAVGDPYVGELKGRIYSVWKVPALETGKGKAIGCVRLDEEGAIVERELKQRSKNTNLDRSVEVALKTAPNMEQPVPEHLNLLLVQNGICFNFAL